MAERITYNISAMITVKDFFSDMQETIPSIWIGCFGAFVRFLYDGSKENNFSMSKLVVGLGMSTMVVWTIAYTIDIAGYDIGSRIQQLIYCWSGFMARDVISVFSKKFMDLLKKLVNSDEKK